MNDTVTIPRAEYDRLVADSEMLADVAAYDQVMADLSSGKTELIPEDFANRLMNGENPVLVYRELRGLSKAGLARSAGVNRVHLLDIESGKSNGSVATMAALAKALGVTVDDLI